MEIHMFNHECKCSYLRPQRVVFENVSKFKQDFIPFLKYFYITSVCTSIKNLQSNALVEQVHRNI